MASATAIACGCLAAPARRPRAGPPHAPLCLSLPPSQPPSVRCLPFRSQGRAFARPQCPHRASRASSGGQRPRRASDRRAPRALPGRPRGRGRPHEAQSPLSFTHPAPPKLPIRPPPRAGPRSHEATPACARRRTAAAGKSRRARSHARASARTPRARAHGRCARASMFTRAGAAARTGRALAEGAALGERARAGNDAVRTARRFKKKKGVCVGFTLTFGSRTQKLREKAFSFFSFAIIRREGSAQERGRKFKKKKKKHAEWCTGRSLCRSASSIHGNILISMATCAFL